MLQLPWTVQDAEAVEQSGVLQLVSGCTPSEVRDDALHRLLFASICLTSNTQLSMSIGSPFRVLLHELKSTISAALRLRLMQLLVFSLPETPSARIPKPLCEAIAAALLPLVPRALNEESTLLALRILASVLPGCGATAADATALLLSVSGGGFWPRAPLAGPSIALDTIASQPVALGKLSAHSEVRRVQVRGVALHLPSPSPPSGRHPSESSDGDTNEFTSISLRLPSALLAQARADS